MGSSKARCLFVVSLLAALVAWADPPELPKPFSELVTQCLQRRDCPMDCEGKLCALMVGEDMPFGHTFTRLWVGPRDSATARTLDDRPPEGAYGVHWLSPSRVALTWLSAEGRYDRWAPPAPGTRVLQVKPDGSLREEPAPPVRRPARAKGDRGCILIFPRPPGQTGCVDEKSAPPDAMKVLRATCPSGKGGHPVLGVCNAAGCALATQTDERDVQCALWIPKTGKPTRLADDASQLGLNDQALSVTVSGDCPNGCDFTRTFRPGDPLVLKIPNNPLMDPGLLDVPPESSGRTSREVVAETSAHVELGQEAWDGPKDLSARWTLTHGAGRLNLNATVTDDHFIPLAMAKTPLASDHLELDLGLAVYDVLLQEKGALSVIRKTQGGPDVPEPGAKGSWSRTQDGYRVQVSLPVEAESKGFPCGLWVSDGDDGVHSKARMGTQDEALLWRTYPPAYSEVHTREIPW